MKPVQVQSTLTAVIPLSLFKLPFSHKHFLLLFIYLFSTLTPTELGGPSANKLS